MQGVQQLLDDLNGQSKNLVIKTHGREPNEDGFVLVKDGHLAGIGFISHDVQLTTFDDIMDYTRQLRGSTTTQAILRKVLEDGSYPTEEF